MQLQTNLVRRGSKFYFRGRIPEDLKSHYKKNEIFISLKTSDKRIADYELAKFKANLYAEFSQLRGDGFDFNSSPIGSLSLDSIDDGSVYPNPTVENLIEYWTLQDRRH